MSDKIMFGICTYNRKRIIEYSSASLNRIKNINNIDICIFDDASQEYDLSYLKSLYPSAKEIIISEKNKGADANSIQMLSRFINSQNEWLFIADSDLIFCEDILNIIRNYIVEYKKRGYFGVISFFNTYTHPITDIIDDMFCRKEKVGAAGVLLNKDVAREIVNAVDSNSPYDVQFSKIFNERGYDILCSQKSYVQHIGIEGYNSLYYTFDWGKDFLLDSIENAKIINNIIDMLMSRIVESNNQRVEDRIIEDIKKKRIGIRFLMKILGMELNQKIMRPQKSEKR